MAVTQAHALVPGLVPHDADPDGDARALDRLALWALHHYAPVCAADPPDGLAIDASGAAHLKGGERALLDDLVMRLKASGLAARAVIAPTLGAAHAVARYRSDGDRVGPDAIGSIVGPLPLAALRLSADLVAGLNRMGFATVQDIERQPRAPLSLRFGPEPGRRLDQVYGRVFEPIIPVVAPETAQSVRIFAEPIGAAETIARHIGDLVVDLCAALEARGQGARRFDLACHRVDNQIEAVRVATARPVRDVKRLTRLLCDRIETIAPGFGIERMTLSAPESESLDWRPGGTRLTEASAVDVSALIDALANRVGARRLYRLCAVESEVPERSVRKISPLSEPTAKSWHPDWPRPTRLFRPPEPIETLALLPDQPPTQFTWRGIRRRVRRADGPERIHGEWARSDAEMWAVRDYFQVEDDAGDRFWLFRAGDGESLATGSQAWFIHGKFG